MTLIKSALLPSLLAGFFLAGAHLQAAMITSSSVTVAATDAGGVGGLPKLTSFSLPEFNPTLGTLTGVEVDVHLTYQGELDVLNFLNTNNPFTNGSSTTPIDLTTPSTIGARLGNATEFVASGVALPPSFSATAFLSTPTTNTLAYNPLPANYGLYTGGGSNSYTLFYAVGTYMGMGASLGFGGDANSSGTATVTYTYIPAPEPASIVMLGLGAIGVWWAAARRRKS